MNVMVSIPHDLAARFGSEAELSHRAVEALALAEYLAGRLTGPELSGSLGFATRGELNAFLKKHGLLEGVSDDAGDQLRHLNGRADKDGLVAQFQTFAAGHTLGLEAKQLISEGRR